MIKNVLIGLLVVLLLIAGVLIFLDRGVMDLETKENSEIAEELEKDRENKEEKTEIPSPDTLIIGTWRSIDDPQSQITFQANGEIIEIYGGGALHETGTYQMFGSRAGLPLELDFDTAGPFLRQSFDTEDYYYVVNELTDHSLVLLFVSGRGTVLRYER